MISTTASQPPPPAPPTDLSLLVSLATIPFLGVLVIGQMLNRQVQELGVASEELFRGDRLPLLPSPDTDSTS